jgi:hypothetical protein
MKYSAYRATSMTVLNFEVMCFKFNIVGIRTCGAYTEIDQ